MNNITPAVIDRYQAPEASEKESKNELGQDAFLKLMLTQLKHQDPMKPMENGDFLGQMAQFSTVSGIEKMQGSIETLANSYGSSQTLQATRLVGQEVMIDSNTISLASEESVSARFELSTATGNVEVDILDSSGSTVRTMKLGEHSAGRHDVDWDGQDDSGNRLPPGDYTLNVRAAAGEEFIAAPTMVSRLVDSVEFGAGGDARLNTKQGESLDLNQIREIRQALSSDAS